MGVRTCNYVMQAVLAAEWFSSTPTGNPDFVEVVVLAYYSESQPGFSAVVTLDSDKAWAVYIIGGREYYDQEGCTALP